MAKVWFNNQLFEAILFDLDGVIIDSNEPIINFWKREAAQFGIELTETTLIQHVYGVPARDTVNRVFNKLSFEEKETLLKRLADFEANLDYQEISGAVDFVKFLKKIEVDTALVTSSKRPKVDIALNKIGLTDAFTVFVTADLIKKGKPDSECYRTAAEKLGKHPEHCLVFEDAISGVKAALAAGASCIGVQQGSIAEMLRSVGTVGIVTDYLKISFQQNGEDLKLIIK